MRSIGIASSALALLLIGAWLIGGTAALASDKSNDRNVTILDNCDPADPGWAPTGGCTLKPNEGDVRMSEFGALLFSPLGPAGILIGHPSWRNEPSYLTIEAGKSVSVRNRGGRAHTFTKVANFGGGFVPPLNGALAPAPECIVAPPPVLAPGGRTEVTGLAPGLHRFQCCIHPWMRAAIRVR